MTNGLAPGPKATGQGNLRQLGGLTRARLAAEDEHLMGQQGLRNFLPTRRDRKFRGKLQTQGHRPVLQGLGRKRGGQSHAGIIGARLQAAPSAPIVCAP